MDFVLPDQLIDRTKGCAPSPSSEGGLVGHVGFADPFDAKIAQVINECASAMEGDGVRLHERGLMICMGKCAHTARHLRARPRRWLCSDSGRTGRAAGGMG